MQLFAGGHHVPGTVQYFTQLVKDSLPSLLGVTSLWSVWKGVRAERGWLSPLVLSSLSDRVSSTGCSFLLCQGPLLTPLLTTAWRNPRAAVPVVQPGCVFPSQRGR